MNYRLMPEFYLVERFSGGSLDKEVKPLLAFDKKPIHGSKYHVETAQISEFSEEIETMWLQLASKSNQLYWQPNNREDQTNHLRVPNHRRPISPMFGSKMKKSRATMSDLWFVIRISILMFAHNV